MNLNPFAKKSSRIDPLPAWADYADNITAMGYEALPIERYMLAQGHEQPAGAFAFGIDSAYLRKPEDFVAGILPGRLPFGSYGRDDCARTAVAGVRLTIPANKKVADALEGLVREIAGAGPARLCYDAHSRLLPFRITEDPRQFAMSTKYVTLPKDPRFAQSNRVTIESAGVSWLLTGGRYHWRDGDLTVWPRETLPHLSVDAAREIIGAVDGYLDCCRPPEPLSPLQARIETIRKRARAEAQS